jgi:hypothetical protein
MVRNKTPVTSFFVTLIFAASSFIHFCFFVYLSPPFFTLFESLLFLKNTTFVDGMEVSMMVNGMVSVEYSAKAACSCKISLF